MTSLFAQLFLGCDLLSNFVLSNFDNNSGLLINLPSLVVICFQTLFFLILITTDKYRTEQGYEL